MLKTFTTDQVLAYLKKRVESSSIRKTATDLNVSGAYVHDVLKGRRMLSENMGMALGFDLIPPPTPKERKWKLSATDAATSEWERDKYPQAPKPKKGK